MATSELYLITILIVFFMRPGANTPPYRVKADAMGRVLLPVATRQRYGIRQGEELILEEDEQGVRLKTVRRALEEAQAYFAALAPTEVSLSEELLRDRREDAARE